jgi:hypothetical protein
MRVYFILDEHYDGRILRRFYDLALLRDRNPSFSLTWTAFHPIDPSSPLYGRSRHQFCELPRSGAAKQSRSGAAKQSRSGAVSRFASGLNAGSTAFKATDA